MQNIQGDAWYNLTGEILTIFPLYGDGDIWLEIYDLDVYAKAAVIMNDEWTPDSGLVTAAFKIRRRFIVEKYKDVLEELYK